jgi:hypothetical protein
VGKNRISMLTIAYRGGDGEEQNHRAQITRPAEAPRGTAFAAGARERGGGECARRGVPAV